MVVTLKKSKLKILLVYRNLCLSKKEVFRKLPVQKTGLMGPGKVPGPSSSSSLLLILLLLIMLKCCYN